MEAAAVAGFAVLVMNATDRDGILPTIVRSPSLVEKEAVDKIIEYFAVLEVVD